ncbi:MAG: WD40 repeat domain-containing protein [Candidatus Thorarchaeota archaeon]
MRRWKEAGIILDPDIIGGVDDDYAQFCTYDEAVALKEGFEEEVFEEEDEEDEAFKDMIDKTYPPLEFQINEHLAIKTMGGLILIFIDDEPFRQCRYLLLVNPQENDHLSEINSIDEAEPLYKNDLENRVTPYDLGITYEQEFWAHCSNIQAWVEHEYDSRLLHRNLAFPLLKKLTDVGDGKAKKVFKDEIAQRFVSGYVPVMLYLFQENYLDVLTSEEFNTLLDEIDYSTLDVRKILAQIGALTSSKYYTQFLVRLRDEFQEFLEENTIYIEIGEYKFDTSEMSPVVITPDSNYFIRGSNDGKLKEFNILTGELVRVFGNHEGPVYALAISEDGSYLASSSDKTIKVWSYALGSHLFTLEAHDDAVNCLQFDPDGEFLLSGSVDDTIKVWNLKDRVVKRTLTSHWGEVVSLAFSEDGDLLVSGALDKTINIWDTHKGVLQTTLIDPEPYLQGVAITKYKDLVVSSSYQNIKIWDLNTQRSSVQFP